MNLSFSFECNFIIEVIHRIGDKNKPCFLTQWNHRSWGLMGVNRGYVSIIYPGADVRDVAPMFQKQFKNESSFALIAARAFVASRVIDYVFKYLGNSMVNCSQIAISGHSRNGKQSLIASAFDDRITAVVGSSPGAPIASPFHFTSSNYYGEGPVTGGVACLWWLCSIVQNAGHPENFEMDGHGILGLIAPRHVAIATAHNDFDSDMTFANEMSIREADSVFKLYNASYSLKLLYRRGGHHGFDNMRTYFDFFDYAFGRSCSSDFEKKPLDMFITPTGFQWDRWNSSNSLNRTVPEASESFRSRVQWLLGLSDGDFIFSPGETSSEERQAEFIAEMLQHEAPPDLVRKAASFSDYVSCNLYWKNGLVTNASKPAPAVVFLHPYSYNTGYSPSYGQAHVYEELARAGFIVMVFDMIGFGLRNRIGGRLFYERHGPERTLFGHMVKDAVAAVDFLYCRSAEGRKDEKCNLHQIPTGTYPNLLKDLPYVDKDKIFMLGYSLGGNVGLHTASLDPRVAGVVAMSSFTPMAFDTADRPTGGLRRLSELHALLPKLGWFVGHENQVVYDYDELISSISPRPVFIYSASGDRDANITDVKQCIEKVKIAWREHPENFEFQSPNEITLMESKQTQIAVEWLMKFK